MCLPSLLTTIFSANEQGGHTDPPLRCCIFFFHQPLNCPLVPLLAMAYNWIEAK